MGTKEKLIKRLKSNPKDFTFIEMQTALNTLGFRMTNKGKTSGSRVIFQRGNISIRLHKPHPRKNLHEYQVKLVLEVLEKENLVWVI